MGRRWTVAPKDSFYENVKVIVPLMYDRFMSHAESVVNHPRLTGELHRMRIEGKPLRYLLELFENRLGEPMKRCFTEIKDMVELMGKVHDCDIMILMLQNHLRELRFFNVIVSDKKEL